MKQLIADVEHFFLADPRAEEFKAGGGVKVASSLEELAKWTNHPYLAIIDSPTAQIKHWSSYVRERTFPLQLYVVGRIFDRRDIIMGGMTGRGLDELYKTVIDILDHNRFGGLYSKVFLRAEGQATPINPGDKKVQQKGLILEYTRIEA